MSRPRTSTSPDARPRSVRPGALRAAAATRRTRSSPGADASRSARAEPEFPPEVSPLDAGVQDVQDPAQHLAVRQRLPPRMPEPPRPLRQQLQAVPQLIWHDPRRRPHTWLKAQLPSRTRPSGPTHLIALLTFSTATVLGALRTPRPARHSIPQPVLAEIAEETGATSARGVNLVDWPPGSPYPSWPAASLRRWATDCAPAVSGGQPTVQFLRLHVRRVPGGGWSRHDE